MSKKIVKRTACPFCTDGILAPGVEVCQQCEGVGEYGEVRLSYECSACETTGKVEGVKCEDCDGNGYIPVDFEVLEDMVSTLASVSIKCDNWTLN